MTLSDAIENYLNWKATHTNRAPVAYRVCLKRFRKVVNKHVEKIKLDDVVYYHQWAKGKYSPASLALDMSVIKNFVGYLFANRQSDINPTMIRIPKFTPIKRNVVTPEEFNRMDSRVGEWEYTDLQKKLILRLLWNTGIRVSELCDLRLDDIDTKKCCAHIETKKAHRPRWIKWDTKTHELLLRYLGARLDMSNSPFLLVPLDSKSRVTCRTVQRWIKEISKRAQILKTITPHSFRHGFSHDKIHKGASVKELASMLGHSEENPKAAFQYIKLDDKEAMQIWDKFI